MGDFDPRGAVATILVIIAALLAYQTSIDVYRGDIGLAEAFRPDWIEFAIANPILFAFILVIGTLLFGGAFVMLMENV